MDGLGLFSWTYPLSIFFLLSSIMSRIIRICPGVGDRKGGAFLSFVDRDTHPACTRCRGYVCASDMFCAFVLLGRRLSGNVLLEEYLQCVRRLLALQALFLLRLRLPHARKLLREFRFLGLLLLLLPSP